MEVQQSRQARSEQDLETAHLGVPENDNYTTSPHAPCEEEEKSLIRQLSHLSLTVDSSTTLKAPLTPNSPSSSCPSTLGVFERSQNTDGRTPETAITISSDSEEDLVTLLRRHQKSHKVTRQDNWDSLDLSWKKNSEIHGNKPHKTGHPTSCPKSRKRQRPIDAGRGESKSRIERSHTNKRSENTVPGPTHTLSTSPKNKSKRPYAHNREHRLDANKNDSQIESHRPTKKSRVVPQISHSLSLPPDNQTRHSKESNERDRFNIQKVKHETTNLQTDKGNGKGPCQVNRSVRFHSNIESAASKSLRVENAITRINSSGEIGANNQTTEPHGKGSHTAKKSKLARFRRANRTFEVHPDTVSEPDAREEPQQGSYVTARIDSGELLKDTRPVTISEPKIRGPRPGRSNVTNRNRNINQRFQHPPALNHPTLDDVFKKHDQPSPPRTQSEEREAVLIQQFESRQRPREYVVPELKWGYTIKFVDSVDIILDDKDKEEKTMTDRSFADREKANEYLYKKTSPEAVGGLEAIASRTTTLEGPERLLKVDITLTNGDHHLMWVERGMVALNNLKEEKRRQVQWQSTPRPKFPHYIVMCDLITYETSPVTRCEDDEDDAMSLDDQAGELGSSGLNIGLQIEKLPPMTFTIREMANEHAAKLFLQNTRVDKRFAEPSDVHWWKCNALPEHKRAVIDARKPDGLYELAMEVHDMNSRLGWDQILVHVHEVDDVNGPVNF
ncbi:hypothetical protein F4801DRAFT_599278 [Xylaria longipes]|nr:hypothetical protein F4801DRAFT_599278 [Xylaria longipes]RYC57681.1 hypothetical protein CHU98_g8528 [Xylaria longipes]